MDVKTMTMDGLEITIRPLPVRRALKLDKKVITMLLPAFEALGGLDLNSEIDVSKLLTSFSKSLESMSDSDFEQFIIDMFYGTKVIVPGKPAYELDAAGIDEVFQGKMMTVYRLLIEIMKYNKFTPFELGGDGHGIKEILFSKKQTVNGTKAGEESQEKT